MRVLPYMLVVFCLGCKGDTNGPESVSSVDITGAQALQVGDSVQLSATVRGPSGALLTGRTITWTALTPSLVSVTGTGKVKALAAGSALVEARSEGRADTATITVGAAGPPTTALHALVYFPPMQHVLVFGGTHNGMVQTADFWSWNGQAWNRIEASGPGARIDARFVFDSRRNRALLLGGFNDSGPQTDMWAWDGQSWTRVSTNVPALAHPGAGYDPERDRVVLLGGVNGDPILRETWEWDSATWTRVSTSVPATMILPTPLVYDAARKTLQTIVGDESTGTVGQHPAQFWEWDGTSWTARGAAGVGEAGTTLVRGAASTELLNYHPAVQRMYRWNGTQWSAVTLSTAPGPRYFTNVVRDDARQRVFLFGGITTTTQQPLKDAWTFDGTTWTQVWN